VEVLSPSTQERDQELKRKVYARYGVREYWLVDPGAGTIQVMGLEDEDFRSLGVYDQGNAVRSQVIPGLALPVTHVFPAE